MKKMKEWEKILHFYYLYLKMGEKILLKRFVIIMFGYLFYSPPTSIIYQVFIFVLCQNYVILCIGEKNED